MSRHVPGLAILVSLLLGGEGLHAQSQVSHGQVPFKHLTNRDGLSQVTVEAILQDRHGFLWFGTSDGLNRWDGHAFELFNHNPDDPESLSNRLITCLYEDRSGALWIGTNDGLNRLDPNQGRFHRYLHDPQDPRSLSAGRVLALAEDRAAEDRTAEDRAGDLWIGTDGGLGRLDPERRSLTRFRHDPGVPGSLSHDRVQALLTARDGGLWVGTGGGLDRFDPATERFFQHRAGNVFALTEGRDGVVWIGSGDGLERFDPATGRSKRFRHDPAGSPSPSFDHVDALGLDRSGILWLGTRGGVGRFDPRTERFVPYPFEPGSAPSSYNEVKAVAEDRDGSLWFGTAIDGAYRHDPDRGRFAHFHHAVGDARSLSTDVIYALLEDHDGHLWVGTRGGGLDRFDPLDGGFIHHRHDPGDPLSLGGDYVRGLHEDRHGNLWIGTDRHGLDRLDPARRRFHHFRHDPGDPRSVSSDVVYAIEEDRSGTLWIGTYAGLDRYDPTDGGFVRYQQVFDDPEFPEVGPVADIIEDRRGLLWIGTYSGLVRLDPSEGSFTRFRIDKPNARFTSNRVLCLLESRSGDLWIGTDSGLRRFDPGTETFNAHFTAADGLGNNVVYAVLEDELERLWISTNRGLVRFEPAAGKWRRYDVDDGLQDTEFSFGAAHRGADGTMYFGGIRGFNAFRPESFRDHPQAPPVVLTAFEIFDRTVERAPQLLHLDEIELSHDQNFFTFHFAALSFVRPDRNRYSYQLEGLDEGWIDAGELNFAGYTKVPHGDYVFRVRGANSDGVWNEEPASVRVVVRPPVWLTWWAQTLYVAALSALIAAYVTAQRRKLARRSAQLVEREQLITELEAKNTELERFNYTISHDLRNPLVTITNFLGLARRDLASSDLVRLEKDLSQIDWAAGNMSRLLGELLELSRIGRVINPPESVPFGEIVGDAAGLLEGTLRTRGVELVIAPDLPVVQGDRARLTEVCQNLLENAVKFSVDRAAPRVEVGVRHDEEGETLYVRDNGTGIEPDYHEKIFGLFERLDARVDGTGVGLALVKRIVEVHGGRVWVESQGQGYGSTFCLTLPKNR